MGGYPVHEVHDVTAGADAGVNDLHIRLLNRCTEFALQYLFNASTHEINDFLWCIDNTIGIRSLHRVALEEAFVDSIQKELTFKPAINAPGCTLYCHIKAVKQLEELVTVEGTASEGINHF